MFLYAIVSVDLRSRLYILKVKSFICLYLRIDGLCGIQTVVSNNPTFHTLMIRSDALLFFMSLFFG